MIKCDHIWEYRNLKNVPDSHIVIECGRCNRVANINIERLLTSKYVEKMDNEITLRDIVSQLRTGAKYIDIKIITEALAKISDRLDKLEERKWSTKL